MTHDGWDGSPGAGGGHWDPHPGPPVPPPPGPYGGPAPQQPAPWLPAAPAGPPPAPWASGSYPLPPVGPPPRGDGNGGGGRWIVLAAAFVLLALLGVGIAWFLTGTWEGDDAASSPAKSPSAGPSATADSDAAQAPPTGVTAPLRPTAVSATCQADPGVDSAGETVTYEPELTLDGLLDTAWRCPGSAVGVSLTYTFDTPVTVTEVGLVPGYAKVDPSDGTDRFAENRTVTAVTWRFEGGETHLQSIASPGPTMATETLPTGVTTTRFVLEIADTGNPTAERDFTAISDVQISGY